MTYWHINKSEDEITIKASSPPLLIAITFILSLNLKNSLIHFDMSFSESSTSVELKITCSIFSLTSGLSCRELALFTRRHKL